MKSSLLEQIERAKQEEKRLAGLPRIVREFWWFHRTNPHVWERFQVRAFEALQAGKRDYSARTIIAVIRFDIDLQTDSQDEFEINNNHSPGYARLWARKYPQHRDLFRYRRCEFEQDPMLALSEAAA